MNKHTFDADDKALNIALDGENITITTARQLTAYDIKALDETLEEVSLWVRATDAYERAIERFTALTTLPDTSEAEIKRLSDGIMKLGEDTQG